MGWNMVGAIGETLGAIGVIASLLYLAVQVKGDREATKANTIQMQATQGRDLTLALATSEKLTPLLAQVTRAFATTNPELRRLFEDQFGVDDEGAIRLHSFWSTIVSQSEAALRMPMSDSASIEASIHGVCRPGWRLVGCGEEPRNCPARVCGRH